MDDGLNVFYINPDNAIKHVKNTETDLYKIILKENVNCIPLANIMYYNNNNKTLPLGMHVTDGIIINTKDLKLKQKEKLQNYIIKSKEDLFKPNILKVNIYEYEIC